MASILEAKNNKVAIKLNNGTSSTGAVKTISVSLGTLAPTLSKTVENGNKIINIVNALAPMFARSLYSIEWSKTDTVSEE